MKKYGREIPKQISASGSEAKAGDGYLSSAKYSQMVKSLRGMSWSLRS